MNLVDAIRKASFEAREPVVSVQGHLEQIETQEEAISEALGSEAVDTNEPRNPHRSESVHISDENAFPAGPGLNLVRFEVFLTPEQMSAMLRGALSSHRSVMTVREAATYLRIHSTSVERLAMEGNLPGFMIEGSWRFLKTTIDDWVSARQAFPEEGLHDVA